MAETLQIRVSAEEQERFKRLAEEIGLKHGETLSVMMNALESEKAASIAPDMSQSISDFNAYISQIQHLYSETVQAVGMQKDLARENVRHELEAKDSIISDLAARAEKAEAEAKDAAKTQERLAHAEEELAQARKTITALQAIRDAAPDPAEYRDLERKVIELEAASAEKDRLIERLLGSRQTDQADTAESDLDDVLDF